MVEQFEEHGILRESDAEVLLKEARKHNISIQREWLNRLWNNNDSGSTRARAFTIQPSLSFQLDRAADVDNDEEEYGYVLESLGSEKAIDSDKGSSEDITQIGSV